MTVRIILKGKLKPLDIELMFCYTDYRTNVLYDSVLGGFEMDIGMLWFDNDSKADFTEKIKRAVSYYHTKYGKAPNLCLVNPRTLGSNAWNEKSIEIRTTRSVLPNHFWLGVNKNGSSTKS